MDIIIQQSPLNYGSYLHDNFIEFDFVLTKTLIEGLHLE